MALFLLLKASVASSNCGQLLEQIQSERLLEVGYETQGILIQHDAVPGYSAAFNPGYHPGSGILLVRMARNTYEKKFTGDEYRGYSLVGDYISDIGMFSRDGKFIGMFAATGYRLEEQINKLRQYSQENPKDQNADKAIKSLTNILQNKGSPIPSDLILEDPRFQVDRDGSAWVFVTAVPAKDLVGGYGDGSPITSYRMAAMKVEFSGDPSNPLTVSSFKVFGPGENKDTWFYSVEVSEDLVSEIRRNYSAVGEQLPENADFTKSVIMQVRLNGEVQQIPFPSIEAAINFPKEKYEMLFQNKMYRQIFQPDRPFYRSVGNNDQPFKIQVSEPRAKGLSLYLFHATRGNKYNPENPSGPAMSYLTYASLMDQNGRIVAVSPLPIQSPKNSYEKSGDVNWVVFHSASEIKVNAKGEQELVLIYGGADSVVATATYPLEKLVDFLLDNGRVDHDFTKGILIQKFSEGEIILP